MPLPPQLLALLRCPRSGLPLRQESPEALVSADGRHRYPVTPSGIPLLGEGVASREALHQQHHYDHMEAVYLEKFAYPHTRVYGDYLDQSLERLLPEGELGVTVEVCCGPGEGCQLMGKRASLMVGVDISVRQLEHARGELGQWCSFVQGDATRLPLGDETVDTLLFLGGIHHVPQRDDLFAEAWRILKPGGLVCFREPVRDFAPLRWISALIYRLSPMLDAEHEEPLRHHQTAAQLAAAHLELEEWRTKGFFGFALFMNSDVLIFPRLFRYVPGIRALVKGVIRLDDWLTARPWCRHWGLIVVGRARKPGPPSIPGDAPV